VAVKVTAILAADLADPPAPALPPPPPRAKGSLAGQVINAATDAPVAGVTVSLRSIQDGQIPTVSAETDAQGRFEFRDLEPGAYAASTTHQNIGAGDTGPPFLLGYSVLHVIIGEGQRVNGVNLRSSPQATISGKLVDESGEPVKEARVSIFVCRTSLGQRMVAPVASIVPDDRGLYRAAALPPGDYYIGVERVGPLTPVASASVASITGPFPSAAETGYATVWYPNAADLAGASIVHVGAGATAAGIDLTLRKTKVVRIRGKVADSTGTLPAKPLVMLTPKGLGQPGGGFGVGNLAVAPDGSFEITEVPAGSYWMTALFNQRSTGSGAAAATPGSLTNHWVVQSVDVKDANIDGIKLEMTEGRTVRQATKVEGGSVPQSCAFLVLFPASATATPASHSCSDGNSSYGHVYPLVYTTSGDVRHLPANYYVKSIRYGGRDIPKSGVDLSGAGELEVTLGAAAATVEGVVTDSRGRSVGGAFVVVAPTDGSELRMGNADSLGNYYFANLAPGEYRLFAWESVGWDPVVDSASLAPFAAAAKTVKLGHSARETLPLTAIAAR